MLPTIKHCGINRARTPPSLVSCHGDIEDPDTETWSRGTPWKRKPRLVRSCSRLSSKRLKQGVAFTRDVVARFVELVSPIARKEFPAAPTLALERANAGQLTFNGIHSLARAG